MLRPALLSVLILAVFALGCDSGKAPPTASTAAARQPVPSASPGPVPTPRRDVSFKTADGQMLAGDLYLARDHSAPAVVLVHRQGGARSEFAPLVERLVRADQRFTVLAFDRRGAGASPPPKGAGDAGPGDLGTQDVRAAIAEVLKETNNKARGVVLVGSSLGAALVSRVAFDEPKVTALALISPGAVIEGVDVYHPFAQVRNLPAFLAASEDDNVSREPLDALARMAMAGTVKRYAGKLHSAKMIGDAHPELWKDLEAWLMGVFDDKPQKRQSLYYAPGKEPGKAAGRSTHHGRLPSAGGAGR